MKRIREINVNTNEYWNRFSTDAYQAADLRRGGNKCKFLAVKDELIENIDILDIGCLNGNIYNYLKENNFVLKSFVGVDISEKLIERANNRFPEQKWIVAECHKLPFEDKKFDVVLMLEILEHIEEPDLALKEAKRVCKDTGKIIISVPNDMKINDGAHVWSFNIQEVADILVKLGTDTQTKYICDNRNIMGIVKTPLKLHVGCGSIKMKGYVNTDISKTPATDIIADCFELPFQPETVDEISSYHLIEHFDKEEALNLLRYWHSLLKVGGKIIIECPNIVGMVKRFLNAYEETNEPNPGYLFGHCSNINREHILNDYHKWGYTQETIKKTLEKVGFESVIVSEGTDYHAKGYNYEPGYFIRAEAIKLKKCKD